MQRRTSSNSRKLGNIPICATLIPETGFRAPADDFRARSGIPLHPKKLTQDGCANFAWSELVDPGVHQQLLRQMHMAPQACPRFVSLQHCTGMSVAGPSVALRKRVLRTEKQNGIWASGWALCCFGLEPPWAHVTAAFLQQGFRPMSCIDIVRGHS